LDHSSIIRDPFTQVFLKEQRDLPARFDTIVRFVAVQLIKLFLHFSNIPNLRVDLSSAKLRNSSLHTTLDHGSSANALLASLESLIRRGLGNRTKAIAILCPTSQPRPASQGNPSSPTILHIGLIYDTKHAFHVVDHGPAADNPDPSAAELFRDFWGDKAELRRFKDGRIVESVVWDIKTSDERAHIPVLVVRHILARHFGIMDGAVQTWQSAFDNTLKLPATVSTQYVAAGVATGFKGAIGAFDTLVKGIKAVDHEFPLSLLNVSPASEYLRYTSVFSPVPVSASLSISEAARYLPSMEIVLEFEKSAKWPDDLRAVQKTKLAFYERLAMVLMTTIAGVSATVVVSDSIGSSEFQDTGKLEIVTPDGWAFSARIWHEREATLLDRIIGAKDGTYPCVATGRKDEQEVRGREYQDALMARELYTRRFDHAPRHHRAIASLCHRFPAYGGTVRLVKRWLASHWLLRGHISEEVVEIICASLFVGAGKDFSTDMAEEGSPNVPGSRERGFSAVIEFLKDWTWERGLFVPLYGSVESNSSSVVLPSGSKLGVWTVSTEADMEGHIWTSYGPDAIAAHRVRALAKATWDCLQGMEHGNLDVKVRRCVLNELDSDLTSLVDNFCAPHGRL
jgi:U3 small nucleolar RNA-associated protein 22